MTWTDRYWDALDDLYWWPRYLGLKSIPRAHWISSDDRISVPREMTNPNGPLYRRTLFGEDYWDYIRRQEEPLNHLLDLAFSIAPGTVISDLFGPLTRAGAGHDYTMLGNDVRSRYGWARHANITTPDCFFVAATSVLAVELKFNAKTSLDQLCKYLVLFAAEEELTGGRPHLDLVYVFNSDPASTFERQTGLAAESIDRTVLTHLSGLKTNSVISAFVSDHAERIADVLDRISICCIDWAQLVDILDRYCSGLGTNDGDQTLCRLLSGLSDAIRQHPLSKVG